MKRRDFIKFLALLPLALYAAIGASEGSMDTPEPKSAGDTQFVFDGVNGLTFAPTKLAKIFLPYIGRNAQ